MVELVPNLKVFGGDDRIDALTTKVTHGDTFNVGSLNVKVRVQKKVPFSLIFIFGLSSASSLPAIQLVTFATLSLTKLAMIHLRFLPVRPRERKWLTPSLRASPLSGDTLFLGGCGRFFEGDATQMHRALVEVLGQLPDETRVYCGHEYSLQNLKFGQHVEPNNEDIVAKIAWCQEQRNKTPAVPTVPSTIGILNQEHWPDRNMNCYFIFYLFQLRKRKSILSWEWPKRLFRTMPRPLAMPLLQWPPSGKKRTTLKLNKIKYYYFIFWFLFRLQENSFLSNLWVCLEQNEENKVMMMMDINVFLLTSFSDSLNSCHFWLSRVVTSFLVSSTL